MKNEYSNYGTFKVTTEADCEGRLIKHLGTYTGYVDEIAFALADKCFYSLTFSKVKPEELDMTPKKNIVKITLDIDSGVWDLTRNDALEYYKNFFKDRNVEVKEACGHGSCIITTEKETIAEKRAKILQKLSDEEKKILGLL